MTANRKVTGTASSMAGGLAWGGAVSVVITILGAMLTAWLVSTERIPEETMGYCAMMILLAASVGGALSASGRIKRRQLYVCGLSGVIYYALLLSGTALFFGGQYQGMGVTALVVLAGTVATALLKGRGAGGRSRKRHQKRR